MLLSPRILDDPPVFSLNLTALYPTTGQWSLKSKDLKNLKDLKKVMI